MCLHRILNDQNGKDLDVGVLTYHTRYDEKGNKVKAQGTDGKDVITPQLKIENGQWMLSMDNGKTWTDIGQATGADGTDGEDGVDGKDGTNGIFKSVTEDNDNVYFGRFCYHDS